MNARRRYGLQWKMIVILTIVWVLLLGKLTIGTIVAGSASGCWSRSCSRCLRSSSTAASTRWVS